MKTLIISNSQKHQQGGQVNKTQYPIPNYDDKNQFQKNFFSKNRIQIEDCNFQQFFYLNDLLSCQKGKIINEDFLQNCEEQQYNKENDLIQSKSISIQEKIVNYIIEYQQQQNTNNKYAYVKKRMTEELRLQNSKNFTPAQEKTSEQVSTNESCNYKCEEIQPQIENNYIENLMLGFENFYKGQSSQIFLLDYVISPDKIIVYLNKAIQKFNSPKQNQKKEDLKISYIGITQEFNFDSMDKEQNFQSLQSFSFMIQKQEHPQSKFKQNIIKSLIQQDQYYLKLNISNKITNQIYLLYRYFLKNKIKQYKPKIIVLFLEINDFIDYETYYFQKLITQLEKISQNSLIIIPLLTQDSPQSYEKYLKYTVLITNSCLDYSYKRKNKAYYQCEDMSAQQYREYSYYFAQTQKEQQYFARQFQALKVRNNQYQSINMDIEFQHQNQISYFEKSSQNELQKNNQGKDFEFNLIGILNLKNQIILTKIYDTNSKQPIKILKVQHFISYNSDQNQQQYFIICIVQDNQLFYKKCYYNLKSEKQIEDQIYLDEYPQFKELNKKFQSSYLLQDSYFYQFNVLIQTNLENTDKTQKINYSGFQYFVQIYKYNLNEQQQPVKYCNQENNSLNTYQTLINFTITQINTNKFIILRGTYQSSLIQQDQDFNLCSYSIMIEMNEGYQNTLKVSENIGKMKSYENSFVVQIDNFSLLYFEAQTKYLTAPIISQIQRLSIFGDKSNLKVDNCQILNQQNFEFYQKKKKLFKSNQQNSKIILQNRNKLVFFVIVQELVQDNLQIIDQEDSINLKMLSKQVQLQAHRFQFTYDLIKQTIDIEIESSLIILEQIEKTNSLRESCLYVNWLEDRNNQYIFNYNGVQNLYLLYFHDKPNPKTRKFIFEDPKDKDDYIDFDEVILNDLDNEQLWIVRKINHQDHISLNLFESDWINLQDVKDSQEDSITKVPISFIYTISQIKEDFCLIGLEVKWQEEDGKKCPYLIICTSSFIYEISIQMIRKIKWENILRYKPNSWEKESLQFEISPVYKSKQVQFNVNMQIPTIVASLKNGDLLLFYSYCNIKKEKDNSYVLEIQYLILRNLNKPDNDRIELEDSSKEFQFKTIKYKPKKEVNIAKINTVIIQNDEFEFSVIVEESDSKLYKVFSGDESQDKIQEIAIMKECKILNDTAPLKNQCIIVSQNSKDVYRLQ